MSQLNGSLSPFEAGMVDVGRFAVELAASPLDHAKLPG